MMSQATKRAKVHIRWLVRADWPAILAIENTSFEFPWSERGLTKCLRQYNCIGMVAEHDDQVVGFMIYELHKARIEVANFATSPTYRRRGAGTQMVRKLIGKLSSQRRTRIVLEVRETNLPTQLFFRACGFRAVSVLHNHYDDTPEDAYLMQYRYQSASDKLLPENRISEFL